MSAGLNFHKSRPDHWTLPRPHTDASLRRYMHGPIQPLHQPSWLDRLLGRC